MTRTRTSGTEDWAVLSNEAVAGDTITPTLPADSVTTFVRIV